MVILRNPLKKKSYVSRNRSYFKFFAGFFEPKFLFANSGSGRRADFKTLPSVNSSLFTQGLHQDSD
jgi:hypothetical protein